MLDDLSPADRAAALKLDKRPQTSLVTCNESICVHWNAAQIDPNDEDANDIPDYVDTTLATVAHIHDTYIAAGYKSPESDGNRGGDSRIDIYLDDIGSQGIYGFCTTDRAGIRTEAPYDTWAFCVLDNDFSHQEFPTNTPIENLQVTAAHEYFHATQYAYDFTDDRWLLESTATWMEDQMFTDVNDNLQYLPDSSLRRTQGPARLLRR